MAEENKKEVGRLQFGPLAIEGRNPGEWGAGEDNQERVMCDSHPVTEKPSAGDQRAVEYPPY